MVIPNWHPEHPDQCVWILMLTSSLKENQQILSSIKMPYGLFSDDCGEVKDIFDKLFLLSENSFSDSKSAFAELLRQKSAIFKDYLNNIANVFRKKAQVIISCDLDDEVCFELYKEMPPSFFDTNVEEYSSQLNAAYIRITNDQRFGDLLERWGEIANAKSPAEWSKKYSIPILCLFDGYIADKARHLFDLINRQHAHGISASEIEETFEFINDKAVSEVLIDIGKCNDLFMDYVSGEYDPILEDVESLKKHLTNQLGDDVYNWYLRKNEIDRAVADYACDLYKKSYYLKVYERIDNLSDEEAKEYLKELIKSEPLVGVKILGNQ